MRTEVETNFILKVEGGVSMDRVQGKANFGQHVQNTLKINIEDIGIWDHQ